jgi:hypothetical protein
MAWLDVWFLVAYFVLANKAIVRCTEELIPVHLPSMTREENVASARPHILHSDVMCAADDLVLLS